MAKVWKSCGLHPKTDIT